MKRLMPALAIAATIIVVLASCSKGDQDNLLLGTWRVTTLSYYYQGEQTWSRTFEPEESEQCTFYDNGTIIYKSGESTRYNVYEYDKELSRIWIQSTGKWTDIELTAKTLVFITPMADSSDSTIVITQTGVLADTSRLTLEKLK